MPTHAPLIEYFLLAARSSETHALDQLTHGCQLVAAVCELVHELQRERGISNIYLASRGERFGAERQAQHQRTDTAEQHFQEYLRQMKIGESHPWDSAPLYHRVARVLLQLDELPQVRPRIAALKLSPADSTRVWSELIAGLLAILFEAADIATDAEISRALVALFHFLQAKEHTGQERAWGSVGFAGGRFDPELKARLLHLRESQQRCLDVFLRFTDAAEQGAWAAIEGGAETADLERLRAMVDAFDTDTPAPEGLSEIWFAVVTARIDAMREVEQRLSAALLAMAQSRREQATRTLQDNRSRLHAAADAEPVSALSLLLGNTDERFDALPVTGSVQALHDLLQEQAEHLQQMSDQLEEARSALAERKLIERAKGLLMQYQGLNEEEAFAALRRSAMEGNCRLTEVATRVVGAAEKLKA